MINKSKSLRILSLSLAAAGFVLLGGSAAQVSAQQGDPFAKPGWAKPKIVGTGAPSAPSASGAPKPVKQGPPPVVAMGAPSINQRIDHYKQLRLEAAENGQPIPKVTSVLTLDEMAIIGVFRTPRGYAAMVEAKPISLSYTIYPGEKFFDGQLVAIEENRLVFRKVVKMSNGKFVASVENKALRQYSDQEQIRGTAPIESGEKRTETAAAQPTVPAEIKPGQTLTPTTVVSPLEEMNRQPKTETIETAKSKSGSKKDSKKESASESSKEKTAPKNKKPVKIAKNK